MLQVESLHYQIKNHSLLKGISFALRKSELLVVTGPNGAGKSTLLALLSSDLEPSSGSIELNGKPLKQYRMKELALLRATLLQQNVVNLDFSVQEIVMMGRYPHFSTGPGELDERVVAEVLEICGLSTLTGRSFLQLSGGEQQRVQLARILAQIWTEPDALLILDEPVAGLDLLYQQQTLGIARALSRRGWMVIAVLHDLNLAAQYADRILMLKAGRRWREGTPAEVLNEADIFSVFGLLTRVEMDKATLTPYVMPRELKFRANEFNSFLPPASRINPIESCLKEALSKGN